MEAVTTKRLNLFAGRHNTELADEVAANLGIEVTEAHLSQFANGETHDSRPNKPTVSGSRPTSSVICKTPSCLDRSTRRDALSA